MLALRDRDQQVTDAYRDRDQAVLDHYRQRDQAALDAARDRDQAVLDQIRGADQARAIEYARSDEARALAAHREAVGYDFGRLVADAQAAGLNPLTVLSATGGANHARTAAPIIETPFIGRDMIGSEVARSEVARSSVVGSQFVSRPSIDRASVYLGGSGAVEAARSSKVASSGYVGDVVAGMGDLYIGYSQEQARLAADRDLAEAIRTGGSKGRAVGRSPRSGGFQTARVVDGRPVGNVPPTGYIGAVLPSDDLAARTPLAAGGMVLPQAPGWSDAQYYENRYGEVGGSIIGGVVAAADAVRAIDDRLGRWAGRQPGESTDQAINRQISGVWSRARDKFTDLDWSMLPGGAPVGP